MLHRFVFDPVSLTMLLRTTDLIIPGNDRDALVGRQAKRGYSRRFRDDLNSFRPSGDLIDHFFSRLNHERMSPFFQDHTAIRLRDTWYMSFPLGTFANNFRKGVVTYAEEAQMTAEALETISRNFNGRLPFKKKGRIILQHGIHYFHEEAIRYLREVANDPSMYDAALSLIFLCKIHEAITKFGTLQQRVTLFPHPIISKGSVAAPLSKRPNVNGHRARGASWTDEEDRILYMSALGQANPRRPLSELEWKFLLEKLNQRNRTGVLARCSQLNAKLKKSLAPNGNLERTALKDYYRQQLGERRVSPRGIRAVITDRKDHRNEMFERLLERHKDKILALKTHGPSSLASAYAPYIERFETDEQPARP